MTLVAEPPLNTLRPRGVPSPAAQDRRAWLLRAVNTGGAAMRFDGATPIIATGHQAWLWHPGILAKDIAAAALAKRENALAVHLVVDHDPHDCYALDLPVVEGDRLSSITIRLADCDTEVPPCCQPACDPGALRRAIESLAERDSGNAASIASLLEVSRWIADAPSLGKQVATLTALLMRPWTGSIPMVFSSDLAFLPGFVALVRRMLADAPRCVAAYNRAAARFPDARIAPLVETLDRVELPLWLLRWGGARERVYADLADHDAILTLDNGTPIDLTAASSAADIRRQPRLAPRALMMTAFLRSLCCDLFIHGKGGGLYDRVTEAWWRDWAGEELAPMSVVSADVRLPLTKVGVPVAEPSELHRAVWHRHHLPHNIDRAFASEPASMGDDERREVESLIASKRAALATLGGPRNRAARATAFTELHRINAALAARFPAMIARADAGVARARAGVANAALARRRDWCFALHPREAIDVLAAEIHAAAK